MCFDCILTSGASVLKEVLSLLDLTHIAKRRTWEISGGEARRAAVARAIVLRPQVIMLDEPDAGLDSLRPKYKLILFCPVCKKANATQSSSATIRFSSSSVLMMFLSRQWEGGRDWTSSPNPQSPRARGHSPLGAVGKVGSKHPGSSMDDSSKRSY